MPVINHVKREINAKIVFVGPRGAGKKTSLALVHGRLRPECRSEIRRRGEGMDELLFFDFLPREIGSVDGYHVRFHLYAAVAGGSGDDGTLRMVLKGVDGVMFVADGSPGREDANRSALEQVEGVFRFHDFDGAALPLVVQLNKMDLHGGGGSELFADRGWDVLPTEARQGEGVLAAVSLLVKKVMQELRRSGVQVQEPEVIPAEVDTAAAEVEAVAARPALPSGEVRWRLAAEAAELGEQNGTLTLPLLLTGSDGRRCRLTIAVTVAEEVE